MKATEQGALIPAPATPFKHRLNPFNPHYPAGGGYFHRQDGERPRNEDFLRYDGISHVAGDSMEPVLNPGDSILYRTVRNCSESLFPGRIYLLAIDIDGEVTTTIKHLYKSDRPGYYRLESANPLYAPFEVPVQSVKAVALIKASMRNLM